MRLQVLKLLRVPLRTWWLVAFACGMPVGAQGLAEGGARALALGRAAVALDGDAWGHYNAAAWSTLGGPRADLFASQAFGLGALRLAGLAAALPTRYGTPALTARTYGFADYRETALGLGYAYAVPLSPRRRLHVGVHLRYVGVSIPDFGSAGTLGLSAGTLVEVMPTVTFGAHARNLFRPRSADADLTSPLATAPGLALGLAYRPVPSTRLLFSVDKDLGDVPVTAHGGAEVLPIPQLALRAGFATAPTRLSAGVGVLLGSLRADVAVERHEVLGMTPAVNVAVQW